MSDAPIGRWGEQILTHSYAGYTRGCRCNTCKAAKADYMRARRAAARALAQQNSTGKSRYVAPIDNHGTRFAYEEHGCRCPDCTIARTSSDARYSHRDAS